MPDGEPEGSAAVQTLGPVQREAALRERVLATVSQELGVPVPGSEDATAATGSTPSGDGAPASTDPPEGGDAGGEAPDPDGPAPLNDPAAFAAWLTARDTRISTEHEERMTNQRRSILGSVQAEQERGRQAALLRELDSLTDTELADRVRDGKDPQAVAALAARATENGAVSEEAARTYALTRQAPMIFKAAEAIKAAGGLDINEVFADAAKAQEIADSPGGVFGWLTTAALEAGGTAAVEKFKRSVEYKKALTDAAENAVRDAFPRMGTPPARPTGTQPPSTTAPQLDSDNPRVRAAARAAARLGVAFDPTGLSGGGRIGGRRQQVAAGSE